MERREKSNPFACTNYPVAISLTNYLFCTNMERPKLDLYIYLGIKLSHINKLHSINEVSYVTYTKRNGPLARTHWRKLIQSNLPASMNTLIDLVQAIFLIIQHTLSLLHFERQQGFLSLPKAITVATALSSQPVFTYL